MKYITLFETAAAFENFTLDENKNPLGFVNKFQSNIP